ncbi:hypothetical protein [Actinacidiphila glaucinigra]|uniref:NADPH-dependent FMN reductase-like domain-containing protein n=1 Tax=Actinacidiphila glaucinigra TaxID=235986 RepID=A0A239NCN5_9ACTN|nr:hypothetical protein [Actinacidiphila glaucinigra]SNT52727.1 hypothetical protein SAMN05216252_13439 [Actinacidiphila glaucinigra]
MAADQMTAPGAQIPQSEGLRAMLVNTTLKPSLEISNTDGLIELSAGIMRGHGVQVETVRAVDHDIATGVWPDMTEYGWASDAWPELHERVPAADVLMLCGPNW